MPKVLGFVKLRQQLTIESTTSNSSVVLSIIVLDFCLHFATAELVSLLASVSSR